MTNGSYMRRSMPSWCQIPDWIWFGRIPERLGLFRLRREMGALIVEIAHGESRVWSLVRDENTKKLIITHVAEVKLGMLQQGRYDLMAESCLPSINKIK